MEAKRVALEDPAVTSDPVLLKATCFEMDEAQNTLDHLYARWAELEQKKLTALKPARPWFAFAHGIFG